MCPRGARLLSGAAVLALACRWRELLGALSPPRRRSVLGAGVATAIYQAAFFAAVTRIGVALGALVALGSAPVFCGLLARQVLRERLPRAWATATACALGGCFLLLPGGHRPVDVLGIGLALIAGACYGLYTVCVKRLLRSRRPAGARRFSDGVGRSMARSSADRRKQMPACETPLPLAARITDSRS
jgi:DME family drug/metabolite transporter